MYHNVQYFIVIPNDIKPITSLVEHILNDSLDILRFLSIFFYWFDSKNEVLFVPCIIIFVRDNIPLKLPVLLLLLIVFFMLHK